MKPNRSALRGGHAVITGGARGIGLATAKRLVGEGCRVSIWDIDEQALGAAVQELGTESRGAVCDIADQSVVVRETEEAERAFGPITVLVNNAGHLAPGDFVDQPMDVWEQTLKINVTALMHVTHCVVQKMYARQTGHVVNISSAAGTIGVPGLAVYSASKWAVWGFSEALRGESRRYNVRVSSIHPSYVAVGMFAGARLSGLGAVLVPLLSDHDRVAKAIVEGALKRGRNSPKRPRSIWVVLLLRALLPDSWFQAVLRFTGVTKSMSTWRGRG